MKIQIQSQRNQARLEIDQKLFPRAAILAAAYVFIDRCYLRLQRGPKHTLVVRIKGKKKLSRKRLDELVAEFENELLHQLLRLQVSDKTDSLREIIIGRALLGAQPRENQSSGSVIFGGIDPQMDYREDPLGIAIPWEEKYGKDSSE